MKIRLQRDSLLQGCRLAERALSERAFDPAMGCVLLRARESRCVLRASGPEVLLRLEVPAAVEQPGDALLPAARALAVLAATAADELDLEAAPGRLRVRGEAAVFNLHTPDAPASSSAGPPADGRPKAAECRLPADLFGRAVRRTLFALGKETPRYSLHAVLWEAESDRVRLVATDSKRLSVAEVPAKTSEGFSPVQRLLPAVTVELLGRLAEAGEETVLASFGPDRAFFRAGAGTLWSRCVEGAFPAWRKAVPPRSRSLFPLPVGPFLSGVRQAAVLREREAPRLLLRFEPGWVTFESQQAGAGQSRVRLPLPLVGGPVETTLSPRFLLDLLRAFDADSTLLLSLADRDTAALFTDGDRYTHVLMPLRAR